MPSLHLFTHEFHPFRGGIATYCHEFSQAAAQAHHYDVTVHGPAGASVPNPSCGYTVSAGRHRGTHNPGCLLRSKRQLRQALKNQGATFLLAEPGPILAYGLLRPKTAPIDLVITLHGSEIQRWQNNRLARWLAMRSFTDASTILTVSQPIAEMAQQAFPQCAHKVRAVCNALPAAFMQQATATQATPVERPAAAEYFQILSVGRLHPRKGYDQVIQAIARLPAGLKDRVRYTVVGGRGKDHYDQALQQLAQHEGVHLTIELDRSDQQLAARYQQADLFCLTSVPYRNSVEGFGLVYLEAGAYGLPALAYDTGGVSDAVHDGATGRLIRTGDIPGLTRQLQRWIEDPTPLHALGRAAREKALSRTWADVVAASLTAPTAQV
jgi:phosphatidylinositol alpha-1,6-mannosyltransferase